jgi:hypothetical protein
MPSCAKCGAEVSEEMAFCPKCGAPLKAELPAEAPPAPAPARRRAEKGEKHEKEEKREKAEKYEKRELSFVGPLIGGLVLIFLGLVSYLQVTGFLRREITGALFLIILGVIIMVGTIYAMSRHPRP